MRDGPCDYCDYKNIACHCNTKLKAKEQPKGPTGPVGSTGIEGATGPACCVGVEKPKEEKAERALRYNTGKRNWSLVHWESIEPMVKVLEYGAIKYSPDNWKRGLPKKEILESLMRHLVALMDGQEIDPESGHSHMGHIMCNAMFYNYFSLPEEKGTSYTGPR